MLVPCCSSHRFLRWPPRERVLLSRAVFLGAFLVSIRLLDPYNPSLEEFARSDTPLGAFVRKAAVKHNATHLLPVADSQKE